MGYLENEKIDIEKIDSLTMYKMIHSLLNYDYFSAKCLVEVFIEQRTDIEELKLLNEIRDLLFEYKSEVAEDILEKFF